MPGPCYSTGKCAEARNLGRHLTVRVEGYISREQSECATIDQRRQRQVSGQVTRAVGHTPTG